MEASITINGSCYSDSIIEFVKAFKKAGWDIYNSQGEIEYLPIGDNDKFEWMCEKITETQLYTIITDKVEKNELVGFNLFYKDGGEGISLLAHDTKNILLDVCINRRRIDKQHTDMSWYLEHII